jgi:urease accessory protein
MAVDPVEAVRRQDSWLVWQLADSAFPTGGFAHSWGLEAAWHSGEVQDHQAVVRFVHAAIGQTGRGALPFVTAAYRRPDRLGELDALSDVFITNPVANRASRVQGRALLATCARVWPCPALRDLGQQARSACGHAAPIAGAALAAIDVPLDAAQRLFLYNTVRGVLAAAVRLGVIGSYDAQRVQFACASVLERVLDRCRDLEETEAAQTAPIPDLLQCAHDRLYSRLFQS